MAAEMPVVGNPAMNAFFAAGLRHATELAQTTKSDDDAAADATRSDSYISLWHALRAASFGGKGVRPELLLRTYAAFGGSDRDAATHLADSIELLHASFVVHDDVIDHDYTRRGQLNVSGTFETRALEAQATPRAAEDLAAAAGILGGNLALVGATLGVARTPAPRHIVSHLLAVLEDAIRVSAAGELRDVELATGVVGASLAQILTMEEQKTAVYSFSLPMQAAAILVDTPAALAALPALDQLGKLVGTAFQLHDDLLGTFGDEAVTGKSALTDLREGKLTPLIAHARSTPIWLEIAPHHGNENLTEEDARAVRAALERGGSRAFVADLADGYLAAARTCATDLGLTTDLVTWLTSILTKVPA